MCEHEKSTNGKLAMGKSKKSFDNNSTPRNMLSPTPHRDEQRKHKKSVAGQANPAMWAITF